MLENVKRAAQFLSTFLYFFYFRWLALHTRLRFMPILVAFLIWFSCLALWFSFDPAGTAEFLHAVYGRLVKLARDYRFAYIFMDPNTAIYFFLIAVGPIMMAVRSNIVYLLLAAVVSFLVILSQSRGGLIAAAAVIAVHIMPLRLTPRPRLSGGRILLIFGLLGLGYIAYAQWEVIVKENVVIQVASDRLFSDGSTYLTGNGRDYHWSRITTLLPMPLGRGYTLMNFGEVLPPHSDLFRLIYAYGVVAMFAAVFFFFNRIITWLPLVAPALMAFLINSLIDEQKLLALYLALMGVYVASSTKSLRESTK
jgi:hypothetical protein